MSSASRRVRIDLAYDGTAYHGWQAQPALPTVQETLERALGRICGAERVTVRGAGRTDAGVHARGQVADATVASRLDDDALSRALGAVLPVDVRARGVRTVPEAFDARRSAVAKTYVYRLDLSPQGDPFAARFALHHPGPVDRAAIADALGRLPGRRDWSGFTSSLCAIEDRVRTLTEARVWWGPEAAAFVFTADGFLTHMVRALVGTLLAIGRGAMSSDRVDAILASGDRGLGGPTAAPRGLCLERVRYPDDPPAGPGEVHAGLVAL